MPDVPPAIKPRSKIWSVIWGLIYTAVIWSVKDIWQLIIDHLADSHITALLNSTTYGSFNPNQLDTNWINLQSISYLLTILTIGFSISWWVNRVQNKTIKVESELRAEIAEMKQELKTAKEEANRKMKEIQSEQNIFL